MLGSELDELELLSVIAVLKGEEMCKNQRELAEDFFPGEEPTAWKQGRIRNMIRNLRKRGEPILSLQGQDGGYFFPEVKNLAKGTLEVMAFKDYMQKRIKSECIILNKVLKSCSRYLNEEFDQLELPF